jgi:branched-chain amino acid aminotransferase
MVVSIWRLPSDPTLSMEEWSIGQPFESLNQASLALPEGVYTTLRTYERVKALHLGDHQTRLEESARLSGKLIRMDWGRVRSALRQAIMSYPETEVRIRLTLDLTLEPGTLYIGLEPLKIPSPEEYQRGVAVATRRMQRQNPRAKATSFITTAGKVRQALPEEINEVLLVGEDGRVLEGLTSNFFAVRQGILRTADEGVLPGITRSVILEEVRKEKLRIRLEGVPFEELPGVSEAFITSASRAVLPVVKIDQIKVGEGHPGPVTLRLINRCQERVSREIELI